jgi:hypothetical protein
MLATVTHGPNQEQMQSFIYILLWIQTGRQFSPEDD